VLTGAMKQSTRPSWRALTAVSLTALFLAGCGAVNNPTGDASHSPNTSSSAVFTTQELMFAQMMIPHHQQAVEMSNLALTKSSNPEILALAEAIRAGQAPEIVQMQSWLDQAPSITTPGRKDFGNTGHSGMHMGGMASPTQMAELATLVSPEFEDLFLRLMIDHHEGALDMVSMIQGSNNPEVSALAADITRVQKEEITVMRALLEDLLGR